jgi:hypothetical protein
MKGLFIKVSQLFNIPSYEPLFFYLPDMVIYTDVGKVSSIVSGMDGPSIYLRSFHDIIELPKEELIKTAIKIETLEDIQANY